MAPSPRLRPRRARRRRPRSRCARRDGTRRPRPSSTARATSSRRRSPRRAARAADEEARARGLRADPKVAAWLARYPTKGRSHEETYDSKTTSWTVKIWWGKAGEIAEGKVDDASGAVTEAWTGPQVAWKMARGYPGAFGGNKINNPWVWVAFCVVFLLGLADWRRPFSVRNLDLLVLLSPSASLWYFNHGDIFTAVPLFYPLLVWLIAARHLDRRHATAAPGRDRVAGLGAARRDGLPRRLPHRPERRRVERDRRRLLGRHRRGAHRARGGAVGQLPDRGRPEEPAAPPTPPARSASASRRTAAASRRTRRATRTGRSRTSPTSPATWSSAGAGNGTPARGALHVDRVRPALPARAVARRAALRRPAARRPRSRSPGPPTRSRSTPRTRTRTTRSCRASSSGASGSSRRPRRAACSRRSRAGRSSRRWSSRRSGSPIPGRRPSLALRPRLRGRDARGVLDRAARAAARCTSCASSGTARSVAVRPRTRRARSGTGGSTTRAGFPICTSCSTCSRRCSSSVRSPLAVVPRRKSPLQLAALTAALLAGFELVLTYWLYTYIPWFFPFAAIALLAPAGRPAARHPGRRDAEELDRGRPARRRCTSTRTPSIRTSPSAGSKRTGSRVRNRGSRLGA